MFSAKTFLKTYGVVGVTVYGSVTAVSIGSIFLALRTGKADDMLITPIEAILGSNSDMVISIKKQLGEAAASSTSESIVVPAGENDNSSSSSINLAREGTYFGIAGIVDSLLLPVKLAACLPLARYILSRRGGR